MSVARACRRLLLFLAGVVCLGAPLKADENDRYRADTLKLESDDWPCKAAFRIDFAETSLWPRPALLNQSSGWRDDADIKALVESAVTSSRTELGIMALERFAKEVSGNAAERDRILTTVYIGLREEMSLYREMAAFGVMQGVAKAELATGIAMDAKANGDEGRQTFKEALRIEDDAMDDARFLCHRLDALESKFQILAEALMRYLTPATG